MFRSSQRKQELHKYRSSKFCRLMCIEESCTGCIIGSQGNSTKNAEIMQLRSNDNLLVKEEMKTMSSGTRMCGFDGCKARVSCRWHKIHMKNAHGIDDWKGLNIERIRRPNIAKRFREDHINPVKATLDIGSEKRATSEKVGKIIKSTILVREYIVTQGALKKALGLNGDIEKIVLSETPQSTEGAILCNETEWIIRTREMKVIL